MDTGEICVLLKKVIIHTEDLSLLVRVVQLIFQRSVDIEFDEVSEIIEDERGMNGFGSSDSEKSSVNSDKDPLNKSFS